MKETERIKRINDAINKHYKSNNDCWWVSNSGISDMIELHKGGINHHINHIYLCRFIFEREKSVKIIHFSGACMIYTRESIKGYFKK